MIIDQGRTALVVEDDECTQQAIAIIFRSLRLPPPVMVSNGEDAFLSLREAKNAYRVIILDFGLPGLNGLEIISKAKSLIPDLPSIIMITGEYDSSVRPKAIELGVLAFYLKSDLHKMKSVLREMFE